MIFANAPWSPSGYGTQAAQLGRTLRRHGHEVAFACYWGLHGAGVSWDGMPVYPGSSEDLYARDVLPGHYKHFGADLLITLMDIWVLEPEKLAGMNVLHWMPVDCTPLSGLDRRVVGGPGRPVALSRFGQKQLLDAGYSNALYVPHALDMNVWSPLEDRDKAREQLGFDGKFVIGVNAANQDPDRKGFWEQLAAFKAFSERHDDARMLIHTRVNTQQGVDLNTMVAELGLQDKAVPGDQYAIASGMIADGQMVSWHGVMDVLSNCSLSEGFGLAILQSQATGVPVVVTDFSSMPELCGAGWKVKGQLRWNKGHNGKWCTPSIPGILAAYEKAWQHARDPQMREKARRFALRYDADRVYEKYWKPILEQMAGGGPVREVQAAGLRWRVGDNVDHGDRLGPAHEETVEQAVLDLLPEGGVFLDVGAHVGHYTLRAAAKAAAVIAVECNPATAARLQENLKLNDITNAAVHQVAAWDKVERLKMESRDGFDRSGDTRVSPDADGTVTGMPLDRILRTDRTLNEHQRLDLVKLDVEGADLHALRGMRDTLARYRPVMVIEDHSVYGCYERDDLEALLKELGYTMRELAMYGCAPYLLAEPETAA